MRGWITRLQELLHDVPLLMQVMAQEKLFPKAEEDPMLFSVALLRFCARAGWVPIKIHAVLAQLERADLDQL